ncbi:hypothetical protein HOP50_03g25120 [Chloropicon primus]|uniref:Dolichol phosphate-mannose biosynthesis regulatory protein n=1 Tax=Chloropicon primus TaxID=1764295 RepID=A0A5B8MIT0_9CHLO|nr:hypothetical protein A3770_03p25120 [Chloropicon primus]UPQ99205.1 hypothetical protein HOP50_03g25120 [Chloropicon primus]|mmetsp:Transcript_8616/g.24647  ORF Transcript_8616/g.24647 Transcript_8616/m.24647 type:complete len:93 (-) Transcript_8616:31-309(-)|eukprot:QDZ19994.1 hypothetical protein A3770_03p25120 [Chloropicon primus]
MATCNYRDRRNELGWALLVVVSGLFAYFTLWIIVVPLLEEDSGGFLDKVFFPIDRFLVLQAITVAGVVMASVVVTSLGVVSVQYGLRGKGQS